MFLCKCRNTSVVRQSRYFRVCSQEIRVDDLAPVVLMPVIFSPTHSSATSIGRVSELAGSRLLLSHKSHQSMTHATLIRCLQMNDQLRHLNKVFLILWPRKPSLQDSLTRTTKESPAFVKTKIRLPLRKNEATNQIKNFKLK